VAVAAWAVCAESREEAQALSSSVRMMMTMLLRGRLIAVPTVERAQRFLAEEGVPPETLPVGRRIIAGDPETVRAELEELVRNYGAEELFVVNILHDHAARRRSYELIAEAFGLSDLRTSDRR
jgi:alkanesulfonate monooxygenase SsuD/methylene tetrahydromethanopterin reductase-like flavin-dependent oxidoreductase (luciferase family)